MCFMYILAHLFSFSSSLPFASCQSYYITLISWQALGNLHPAQIKKIIKLLVKPFENYRLTLISYFSPSRSILSTKAFCFNSCSHQFRPQLRYNLFSNSSVSENNQLIEPNHYFTSETNDEEAYYYLVFLLFLYLRKNKEIILETISLNF